LRRAVTPAIAVLACAVCASADPTLQAPGFEQPFAQRFRLGVDALVGRVAEDTPDGRRLELDDLRLSATATYAPTRDLLFSLTVPALERSLHDVASRTSALIPGDVDARVYGVASRSIDATRRQLGFFGGFKGPTAPIERDMFGVPLPVELEPGCGSIVPYVGSAYAIGRGRYSGQVSAALYLPFSVRDQPHPGDSLRTTAWLQIQATHAFATRFGMSTRLDSTGQLSATVADLNSGGFVGYVTTDVLVSPTTDLVVAAGAMFPVVQAWFGVHRESTITGLRAAYDF
jgi:hypothetical protein